MDDNTKRIQNMKPDELALQQTIDEESFREGYESAKMDAINVINSKPQVPCSVCGGDGNFYNPEGKLTSICHKCNGTGKV